MHLYRVGLTLYVHSGEGITKFLRTHLQAIHKKLVHECSQTQKENEWQNADDVNDSQEELNPSHFQHSQIHFSGASRTTNFNKEHVLCLTFSLFCA